MPRYSLNLARPRQAWGLAKISRLDPIREGAIAIDSTVCRVWRWSRLGELALRVRGTHVLRGVCATRFGTTARAEFELHYSLTESRRPRLNKPLEGLGQQTESLGSTAAREALPSISCAPNPAC